MARRPKRKSKLRPLVIVVLLLGLSGLIRVGTTASMALAERTPDGAPAMGEAAAQCAPDPDIALLLGDISAKQAELDARETQLADRMTALRRADAALREDIAMIEAAEARLQAALSVASTAAQDDLGRLVAVYENMKPTDAAALFGTMSAQFAAGFLAEMRPEAAAQVMAGLDPSVAYAISVIIAGRNADILAEPAE